MKQRQREYLHEFVLQMIFLFCAGLKYPELARGSQKMEQI